MDYNAEYKINIKPTLIKMNEQVNSCEKTDKLFMKKNSI